MTYSRILGTGSYLPETVMTNAMLAERIETSDEWIVSRTGIRARHIAAEDQKTSDRHCVRWKAPACSLPIWI